MSPGLKLEKSRENGATHTAKQGWKNYLFLLQLQLQIQLQPKICNYNYNQSSLSNCNLITISITITMKRFSKHCNQFTYIRSLEFC